MAIQNDDLKDVFVRQKLPEIIAALENFNLLAPGVIVPNDRVGELTSRQLQAVWAEMAEIFSWKQFAAIYGEVKSTQVCYGEPSIRDTEDYVQPMAGLLVGQSCTYKPPSWTEGHEDFNWINHSADLLNIKVDATIGRDGNYIITRLA